VHTSEFPPPRAQESYGFFPPLSPLLSRALGFSALKGPSPRLRGGFSSPVLHRHRGVSPFRAPFRVFREIRRSPASAEHLAEASSLFSISRKRLPLFPPRRSTGRPEAFALASGGSARRVWLPSQRLPPAFPRELLQLPTLLSFPLQSFAPSGRSEENSFSPLRSCAFPKNPLRPRAGASAVFSRPESRSPECSPGFYAGSGTRALLGLSDPSGFPSGNPHRKASPFPVSPPALSCPAILQSPERGASGFLCSRPGISLRKGRRPVRSFRPTVVPHLFREVNPPLTIFSS